MGRGPTFGECLNLSLSICDSVQGNGMGEGGEGAVYNPLGRILKNILI